MTSARYDGAAVLLAENGAGTDVEVRLRGGFEPIDGHYHWWGRIQPSSDLDATHRPGDRVRLRTPAGEAPGRISDVDPWGRFRVSGTGRPPFPTDA